MPTRHAKFLSYRPYIDEAPSLGRVFCVTRETWRLTDDPKKTKPVRETLTNGHSASEAADFARDAAAAYGKSGFHKPSGAWWGSDEGFFHRFSVHPRKRQALPVVATVAVFGLAAALIMRPRNPAPGPRPQV